ncbi:MAG: spore germination protein GerW family protein [Eubacteriales bacterium]|jgi:sporulation protein YtfJ|nr:spore germination protein GerW family protein [Eubacteriales bacterium]
MESNIGEIIKNSLENIKEIADVNTIIGDTINTDDGTSIIPVSKVSLGFASGGVDYGGKNVNGNNGERPSNNKPKNFGGGGGTGVTISPMGFLVIHRDGKVDFLNIACPENKANNIIDSVTEIIEKSPDIIQKIKAVFSKDKESEDDIFGDDDKDKAKA